MAKIGVSKPFYSIYDNDSHTYTGGGVFAKAVNVDIQGDTDNDNPLYADNGIAENDTTFGGGSISLEVDDISPEVLGDVFGAEVEEVTSPVAGTKVTFGSNNTIPFVGFGIVLKRVKGGTTSYIGVVLTKVQFANPNDTANTQEESIDWQTTSVSGTVMRDDTEAQNWKHLFYTSTEANAVSWIKSTLNITD